MPTIRLVALDFAGRAHFFAHLAAMEKAGVPAVQALRSLSVPAAARRAAAVAVRLFQVSVANGFEFPRRREPLCSPATPREAWRLFQHFLDRACVESAPAGAPHQYGNTRP